MSKRATPQNGFSDIEQLRRFLLDNVADMTWRRMAERKFDNRVSAGTLNRIANDEQYEPRRPAIRKALGLPCYAPAPVCPKHGVVHRGQCPKNRKPPKSLWDWPVRELARAIRERKEMG